MGKDKVKSQKLIWGGTTKDLTPSANLMLLVCNDKKSIWLNADYFMKGFGSLLLEAVGFHRTGLVFMEYDLNCRMIFLWHEQ